ncbi:MAG: hypothetical protein ACLP9L_25045 [Thermoguttaceae bacterium]
MLDQLKYKLPLLFRLVHTGKLKRQLADAIAIFEKDEPDAWGRFHDAADAKVFLSRSLLYHLFMSLGLEGAYDSTAELVEHDLEKIKAAGITEDQMRGAFFSKLVNDGQFDDVLYEIASAAIFSQVLDPGTCKLEHPLAGSAVNPDLTGEWQGKRTRIEVKRIDDMPPKREPRALSIVESAEIPGGFDVHLHVPLISESEAEFIKKMIETLYDYRTLKRGEKLKIGNSEFMMGRDYLHTTDHMCPIQSICFNDEPMFRYVQPGVLSGPTVSSTEQAILNEAFPTPEGVHVFDNARVNPSARIKSTKGEHVYYDVEKKLRQCEDGAINIVVLGLSAPHYHEQDFADGLVGSSFVLANRANETEGPRFIQSRTGLGPFTAEADVDAKTPEFKEKYPDLIEMTKTTVSQFRKVSGVLGLRLSSTYPLALYGPNPNAAAPAPANAGELILTKAMDRSACRLPSNP